MNALVGYTGFVGSNLYTQERFQLAYNSKNIEDAFGTEPNLLVYAGVRAEKYLANHDPEKDRRNVDEAAANIERIRPKRVVLVSTVDVFADSSGADEETPVETEDLQPYGYHRFLLEQRVRGQYPDALVVRLPALFGKNLKKNFIYDYLHVIPVMLKEEKFADLSAKDPRLEPYYVPQGNGFRKAVVSEGEEETVKGIFAGLGFSALNFTDSRSRFQFYNLDRLWGDIQMALDHGLRLLHLATEPVSAGEVYRYLTGKEFVNELPAKPADYDFRTRYATFFGGEKDYICGRDEVLKEIREFVSR